MTRFSEQTPTEQGELAYLQQIDSVISYGPAVAIVWQLTEGWPVTMVSPNIEQFGYDPDELLSGRLSWSELLHPDDLERVAEQVRTEAAGSSLHSQQRYRIRTRDGANRWLADYTTFLRDRAGTARVAQGLLIDVTEEVRRQNLLEDIGQNALEIIFRYHLTVDGIERIEILNPQRLPSIGLPASLVAANDPAPLWAAIHPDDRAKLQRAIAASLASTGVWTNNWRVLGNDGATYWLEGRGSPTRHSDGSVSWLVIANDVTERKAHDAALTASMEQTIGVLADAVELRDAYTAGHQRHVADLSVAIGRRLGLPENQLQGLHLAAMVHDVGKIHIPIEILSKPDRLSREEFALVREHAQLGANLLAGVDSRWPIAEIVRQHHERIDGSGYPRGLRGDQILIEAKIIAVADVFESISSPRPYRPGRGIAAATQVLNAGRAIAFEADVVDALMALIDEGEVSIRGDHLMLGNTVLSGGAA